VIGACQLTPHAHAAVTSAAAVRTAHGLLALLTRPDSGLTASRTLLTGTDSPVNMASWICGMTATQVTYRQHAKGTWQARQW
jgi:hypothetical protein